MERPERSRRVRWTTVSLLVALALLHAPSLRWGFFADDLVHRLVLENPRGHPTMRPWNLYDFGGAASTRELYREDAVLPWWTDEDWQGRFFRPLTSLSLWLDHALWGRASAGHHLTSLVLQVAFLLLVLGLYRTAGLSARVALLAAALVGLEDGATFVVGWVANRNSLLEGLLAAGALALALRARGSGRKREAALALLLAALAALCKESGVAALAGCALVLWKGSGNGLRGWSVASGALALLFCAFLALAGYGVKSLFYPTPWNEPLLWLGNLGVLLVAAPLSLLTPFPLDALLAVPGFFWPGLSLAAVFLALVARPWWRALRATPHGAFLAAFALLALVPQASAPPSDRLLFVSAIGVAPITARWLAGTLAKTGQASARARALAWTVAVLALPLSGAALLARGFGFVPVARLVNEALLSAELERRPPARRDALILQGPSVLTLLGPLATWRYHTGDLETRFHPLQMGRRALAWTRVDERSFELRSLDEPFLTHLFERVFRTSSRAYAAGTRFPGSAFEVELLEIEGEGARTIRVRCVEPLESERFVFLAWQDGRLRRIAPPGSGETLELPRCAPLAPLMP